MSHYVHTPKGDLDAIIEINDSLGNITLPELSPFTREQVVNLMLKNTSGVYSKNGFLEQLPILIQKGEYHRVIVQGVAEENQEYETFFAEVSSIINNKAILLDCYVGYEYCLQELPQDVTNEIYRGTVRLPSFKQREGFKTFNALHELTKRDPGVLAIFCLPKDIYSEEGGSGSVTSHEFHYLIRTLNRGVKIPFHIVCGVNFTPVS